MTDQEIAQTLRKHAKAVDMRADGDNLDDPLHAAFDGLLEMADQLDMRRLPVPVYESTPPEPGAVEQALEALRCAASHTPCPEGYLQWHQWAERQRKTHKQVRCAGCNLWAIWVQKVAP